MFRPTHKSVINESISEYIYERPNKRSGHKQFTVQAPNHKSETLKGGYFTKQPILPKPNKPT